MEPSGVLTKSFYRQEAPTERGQNLINDNLLMHKLIQPVKPRSIIDGLQRMTIHFLVRTFNK